MKIVLRFFWAHLLITVGALAVGYALVGGWVVSIAFAGIGALWLVSQIRGVNGLENLLIFLIVVGGAAGYWVGVWGWLSLLSVVAALGAWDLDHFLQRLRSVERVEFDSGIGQDHLRRLLVVEGVGLLAGLAALMVHVRIEFWWIVLLAILAAISISRVIAYVRRETE